MKHQSILCISDTQAPYHHKDALRFLKAVKEKYKPTDVVQIGDLVDNYRFSEWDQAAEAMGLMEEVSGSRQFINQLGELFPKMTVILGNHDLRYYRRAVKAGYPIEFIVPLEKILKFPKGWTTCKQYKVNTALGPVLFEHGHENKGGKTKGEKSVLSNEASTVIGHYHTEAGIEWISTTDHLRFFMVVGCLFDSKSIAAAYASGNKRRVLLGTSLIINGMPHWEPMVLNSKGEWTGELV